MHRLLCIKSKRPQPQPINDKGLGTPERKSLGLITQRKSFADALFASFSNKNESMIEDDVATSIDHESNASQTNLDKDLNESHRANN